MKNIISTILLSVLLTSFCINGTRASDIKLRLSSQHIQELVDQSEFLVKNGMHQSEVLRIFQQALMQETFNGAPAYYDFDTRDQEMLKTLESVKMLKKIGLIYGGVCLVAISFLAGMGLVYLYTKSDRDELEARHQRNLAELYEQHNRENRALNPAQNPVLIALN